MSDQRRPARMLIADADAPQFAESRLDSPDERPVGDRARPPVPASTKRNLLDSPPRATVDIPVAAQVLGISRPTAYRRCELYRKTKQPPGLRNIQVSERRYVVSIATLTDELGCTLDELLYILASLADSA